MKVKIGPFLTYWGPYQIAEKLLFWCNKYEDDRVSNLGEWLAGGKERDSWLNTFTNWVYSKRKRTVKIHIDKYDTWNMDGTMALIILPM